MDAQSLERSFRQAFGALWGEPGTAAPDIHGYLTDNALIIDEDLPFVLDKAMFLDHLAFHADQWEKMELVPREISARVHGATGVISLNFYIRGKPKNAGFRIRPGYMTVVCANDGGTWRALGLHLSPLLSNILDASPG